MFARNKAYWGTFTGNVEEATYTPIGSAPTRVAALLSGELDLITDLPLQDIERVKATRRLQGAAGAAAARSCSSRWTARAPRRSTSSTRPASR